MKVLITGGAGFIGQHLARMLLAEGHQVAALDSLLPQVHADPEQARERFPGEVLVGDVADPDVWSQASTVLDGPPDAVVHLAAETGTGQSMYQEERYHRVNVDGTRLAAAKSAAWGVPLVQLSSRAVYGDGTLERASAEDDPHCPVSVYGETKSLAEATLTEPAATVPITTIRPQNVIGPGQALHNPYTGVLAAFLARLREGRPLTVYGDGSATRDFVHVEDVATLISWCLANPGSVAEHRVINCGTGTRMTLLELAEAAVEGARRASGSTADPEADVWPIEHLDVVRAGDITHACADLTRLRALGAPEPRWRSRDAVIDFVIASWREPGADSSAWDAALDELTERGLTQHSAPGPGGAR